MENLDKDESNNPIEQISMKMIYRSILEALSLERVILFSIIGLSIRPGKTIREYL